ncbi:MAG: hypothetical protein RR327_05045, partial [Clostridia bacterium]
IYNRQAYVSTQIGNYADNTSNNYLQLGYTNSSTSGYIKTKGFDNNLPFVQTPTVVGGSETTYYCDYYWQSTDWRVVYFGCYWDAYPYYGVSSLHCDSGSTIAHSSIGSRLLCRAF